MLGSPFNFSYGTTLFDLTPLRKVGSLDYRGSARLLGVETVPEPGTLALVAAGVGLLLARRRYGHHRGAQSR